MSFSDDALDVSTELTDGIATLKQMQSDAIENLDFKLAEKLQIEIDSCGDTTNILKAKLICQSLRDCLEARKLESAELREQILEKHHRIEIAVRLRVDNVFGALKFHHLRELGELEARLTETYRDEMSRPFNVHDDLIARAKQVARCKRFDQADDMRAKAEASVVQEKEAREQRFRTHYRSRIRALLERQSDGLTKLAIECDDAVKRMEADRANELESHVMATKREMEREYRRVVASLTSPRPKVCRQREDPFEKKLIPNVVGLLKDELDIALAGCGLQPPETAMKPRLTSTTSPVRSPGSPASRKGRH